MKNREKIILGTVIVLIVIYTTARITGVISFYRMASSSMEPNYSYKGWLIATNLIVPKRADVISYKSKSLEVPSIRPAVEGTFLGRLIGIGGDVLEMKDGYAYINGEQVDKNVDLKFSYIITEDVYQAKQGYFQKLQVGDVFTDGINKIVLLDDKFLTTLPIRDQVKRYYMESIISKSVLAEPFRKNEWTLDNLGPIEIPEDYVFILGDNRHNAEDSRMTGFIPKNNIVGVIIN